MEKKEKPEKKKVSRRDFITISTVSAATIALAGVGSAIASDRGGFGKSGGQPMTKAQPQGKGVSADVANLLSMALAEDDFRKELRKNPEAAARSRGIRLSRDDAGVIQGILGQTEATPGQRGPGKEALTTACPYRGFHY